MDKISAEEYRKGQKYLTMIVVVVLFVAAIIAGLLTNYKQETLICSKKQDSCYIERINLINQKSHKILTKFSNVESVSYMRQKVKGNRFAKGYSSYLLIFNLKDNNPLVIFSSPYFDKGELDNDVKNLTEQIIQQKEEIKLNRD